MQSNVDNQMDGQYRDSEEKKRAQNRQAQRLYRQRMKEKVKMLQAKVDAFELYASNGDQVPQMRRQNSHTPHREWTEEDLESIDSILDCHTELPMLQRASEVSWQADEGSFCEGRFLPAVPYSAPLLDNLQDTLDTSEQMGSSSGPTMTVSSTPNFLAPRCRSHGRDMSSPTEDLIHQQAPAEISSSEATGAAFGASLGHGLESKSIEDRVSLVITHARAAGYDNLDSAVHEYYTAALPSGSSLGVEQRLSRNRRLPSMIAGLSQAAETWSEWERRGFQEELVKSAEMVLIDECRSFRRDSHYEIWRQALMDGEHIGAEALAIFQEQLPNLTALVTSLTCVDSIRSLDKAMRLMTTLCFDDSG